MFKLKRKGLLTLLSVGVLLLGCACGGKAPPGEESRETSDKQSEEADMRPIELTLTENGTSHVTVVAEATVGERLAARIGEIGGITPQTVTPGNEPSEGILLYAVNATDYAPSGITPSGSYLGYSFSVSERACALIAYDREVLTEAVAALSERMPTYYRNGRLTVTERDAFSVAVAERYPTAGNVPILASGSCEGICSCSDGLWQVICREVSTEDFHAYRSTLAAKGFTEQNNSTRANNLFYTYLDGDGAFLYASYIGHAREVRLYTAKSYVLPPDGETYARVCTPNVKQLNASDLSSTDQNEGMGYVFRLADGSFLIVDGGYKSNASAKALYDYLKSQAPDPAHIRIACWYISHYHGDHVGTLIRFAEKYANDPSITVESFMVNQCLTPEMIEFCSTESGEILNHRSTLRTAYPNAVFYKPLAGQRYRFADAQIDVLYTISDYLPQTIPNESDATAASPKKGDYNTQSMVSIIKVEDTRFFMMADTVKLACDEMCARYGETLKSDYVQISHHGIGVTREGEYQPRRQNSTKEIYRLIAPDYAFLPCSARRQDERMAFDVNRFLASYLTTLWCAGEAGGDVLLEIAVKAN